MKRKIRGEKEEREEKRGRGREIEMKDGREREVSTIYCHAQPSKKEPSRFFIINRSFFL